MTPTEQTIIAEMQQLADYVPSATYVDNIPVVALDEYWKLQGVVRRYLAEHAQERPTDGERLYRIGRFGSADVEYVKGTSEEHAAYRWVTEFGGLNISEER
jgi:hypothetical protein